MHPTCTCFPNTLTLASTLTPALPCYPLQTRHWLTIFSASYLIHPPFLIYPYSGSEMAEKDGGLHWTAEKTIMRTTPLPRRGFFHAPRRLPQLNAPQRLSPTARLSKPVPMPPVLTLTVSLAPLPAWGVSRMPLTTSLRQLPALPLPSLQLPLHCGTKPGHFETSIIHFPTSERCERTSERTSEWPSTYISILVCSRPQCVA